ncbi:dockerin type I repeat-containing protein [Botrimarina sp.]|uniref:dockerin type I repeat-containing protein n=1 Tax=Botrimarina sp. TaxID=2795802 RepID=UPI0032ED9B11
MPHSIKATARRQTITFHVDYAFLFAMVAMPLSTFAEVITSTYSTARFTHDGGSQLSVDEWSSASSKNASTSFAKTFISLNAQAFESGGFATIDTASSVSTGPVADLFANSISRGDMTVGLRPGPGRSTADVRIALSATYRNGIPGASSGGDFQFFRQRRSSPNLLGSSGDGYHEYNGLPVRVEEGLIFDGASSQVHDCNLDDCAGVTTRPTSRYRMSFVWRYDDEPWIGSADSFPIPVSNLGGNDSTNEDEAILPANVIGTYLTEPTSAGSQIAPISNQDGFVYFQGQNSADPEGSSEEPALAYAVSSNAGVPIESIRLGELPGDNSRLMIFDGADVSPYLPGETHTFPSPVTTFLIGGVDPSAGLPSDELLNSTIGLDFFGEGLADVAFFTIGPPIPGDTNADNLVDAIDYGVWMRSFGANVGWYTNGDLNGDGVINAADYTVWRDNLTSPAVGVPEPTGFALVAVAFMSICRPPHR